MQRPDARVGPRVGEGSASGGSPFDAVLRRAFDAGVAEHGPLALSFETFASRVLALTARRLARGGRRPAPDETAAALERAALPDVFLAVACDERVAGSWERLASRCEPLAVAMAMRRGASRAEAEQIARDLPGQLFTPPDDGSARTRLGTFDGSGSLSGWLAVIVARRVADVRRAARPQAALPPDAAARDAEDPLAAAIGREAAGRFTEAVDAAWRSLTPREALALLLLHRDGLAQSQIARVMAVGEPRVSRIVAAATGKLRAAVARSAGSGNGAAGDAATWVALRAAAAKSLATLPRSPDSLPHG
jgi:RNA polymerase sigma factor (sigma-70 family)